MQAIYIHLFKRFRMFDKKKLKLKSERTKYMFKLALIIRNIILLNIYPSRCDSVVLLL